MTDTSPVGPADGLEDVTLERQLLWLALALGVALRVFQYLAGTSLWLDELALVNGVLAGPFRGLFDGPSSFSQVAPPGFLLIQWILYHLGPGSDLLLRAWALLMGCGTIVAVAALSREAIGDRFAWIPTLLVAVAGPLIFTSAQVKPYSTDVFCAAVILLAAARDARLATPTTRRTLRAAGAIAPFFSLPAVLTVAAVGGVVGFRNILRQGAHGRREAITTLVLWGSAALVSVLLAQRLADPGAAGRWSSFERAFPTIPPQSLSDLLWPAERVVGVLSSLMGLRFASMFVLLAVAGWFVLVRQRGVIAWCVALSLAAAFAAAAVRQYPFGDRVSQWLVPSFALLLGVAVSAVARRFNRHARVVGLLGGAAVCLTPALTLAKRPPPFAPDDIKPVLAYLAASAQPGDQLYAFWGAWHSLTRYAHLVPPDVRVTIGGCPREYPRGHLREVSPLTTGPRLWLLFDRLYDAASRDAILAYLDSIGTRAERFVSPRPAPDPTALVELFRYDMTDTSATARVSADSMPLPSNVERMAETCVGPHFMWRRSDGTMVVPIF